MDLNGWGESREVVIGGSPVERRVYNYRSGKGYIQPTEHKVEDLDGYNCHEFLWVVK